MSCFEGRGAKILSLAKKLQDEDLKNETDENKIVKDLKEKRGLRLKKVSIENSNNVENLGKKHLHILQNIRLYPEDRSSSSMLMMPDEECFHNSQDISTENLRECTDNMDIISVTEPISSQYNTIDIVASNSLEVINVKQNHSENLNVGTYPNLNKEHSNDNTTIVSATESSRSSAYSNMDDFIADPDFIPNEESMGSEILSDNYNYCSPLKKNKEIQNLESTWDPDDEVSRHINLQNNIVIQSDNKGAVSITLMEQASRKNYKDRRDYCIFCEKDVSHFSRHVTTWHPSEIEVQRILSFKSKSNERRVALTQLRKQGNYVSNRITSKLRPVKRIETTKTAMKDSFLPCKYCFGYYRKNSLYRHTKRCPSNTRSGSKKRQTAQSDGQTMMALNAMFKHDQLLKDKLFPRMRADDIALMAKRDLIICNYAYSYMKGRKSKGNLDVVRQNTRRLAKLLIFAKEKHGSEIKDLCSILRPCYFSTVVEAVNEMAKYNIETDRYESPTLAMNFGTLIKKCCDIAYIHLIQLKEDTSVQRKEVKIMKTLVESRWADEISAQAATNLHENRWNKEDLIPLSTDLKKLNDYITTNSEECYEKLQKNKEDFYCYTFFKELLYIHILLLNRRRPAEVAQIKVETYKSINLEHSQNDEFLMNLTETEKILLKTYHRIVIRGKRGRGVPILLSPSMKNHFDLLIEIRRNFTTNNDYIFHTAGLGFIDGTKTLAKHAVRCGAAQPYRITATRLRKHLATICQLLQFSENDLEQLSRFMGHTLKTHLSVYRMSDNMYQTAKVSKLLLLMADGKVDDYVGKKLDDINIDLNPVYENEDIFDPSDLTEPSTSTSPTVQLFETTTTPVMEAELRAEHPPKRKINAPVQKQKWTETQKKILLKHFAGHIRKKQAPRKVEVEEFKQQHLELFKDREWRVIKAYIFNVYRPK
ncbi:hypothetical protein MML48_8g00013055 [Holotrichia oblita]|uniref:Uncharacterized protein n=1 Tax=Holotrichia oblita TaxID=644536 RepID=A0ACB9SU59_HOLOL|nr:hypothetical protein MML48_8g00013055 [Holotrichia oblita]